MRGRAARSTAEARRYPVGAEITGSGVSFRVWAPEREAVTAVLEGGEEHPLEREETGYFSTVVELGAGARF